MHLKNSSKQKAAVSDERAKKAPNRVFIHFLPRKINLLAAIMDCSHLTCIYTKKHNCARLDSYLTPLSLPGHQIAGILYDSIPAPGGIIVWKHRRPLFNAAAEWPNGRTRYAITQCFNQRHRGGGRDKIRDGAVRSRPSIFGHWFYFHLHRPKQKRPHFVCLLLFGRLPN